MPKTPVYLDYNATAPLRPEARSAMAEALEAPANPSSVHAFGRRARRLVEAARGRLARLAGAAPADVVFTSGATEANAAVIAWAIGRGLGVLVSAIEHSCVLEQAPAARRVPVGGDGIVDLAALDRLLAGAGPALVALMAVNNETGVIQPVAEAAAIARRHGALLHCDAVQAAGRIPLDGLGAHTLCLSAHKLGGPTGVGALIADPALGIAPLIRGGGQERGRRGGTENVAGIAGFGAAAEAALAGIADEGRLADLRDELERRLLAACPQAVVFGRKGPRVGGTLLIAMPGMAAETQVMALDLDGVAASAGAACSSGKVRASHVLEAMGAGEAAGRAVRFSLGWASLAADVEQAADAWARLAARRPDERLAQASRIG